MPYPVSWSRVRGAVRADAEMLKTDVICPWPHDMRRMAFVTQRDLNLAAETGFGGRRMYRAGGLTRRCSQDGYPGQVLALSEEAFAAAGEGDVETVDRILHGIVDVARRAAPLPPPASGEVRQADPRLQQAVDEGAERVCVRLGAAGGGRTAARHDGAMAPPVSEE